MTMSTRRPFPIVVTLVSIICIVTMLILGFWQLDRKQQKEERLTQIALGAESDVLTLEQAISEPSKYIDYSVSTTGTADDRLFYIDNKLNDGKPGYHIIQPIRTDFGYVLINLGWVYASDRNMLPPVEPLNGTINQRGVLTVPADNVFIKETNTSYGQFPAVLQQVDVDEIERHLGVDTFPFILLANPEKPSAFVREWQAVVMPPEKHLGYAIQWFGLAIAALTVYLISIGNYYKKANSANPQKT
ncbi:MAG: SURF1 family protein [Pseudomonadota bacterium]